jgi:hypothetical protein
MYQEINEPISVVAAYAKGKVSPEKVEWGKRVYEVKKINNDWRQKAGTVYHLYFSVETDRNTSMVIVFDPSDLSWRLASINAEG